MELLARTPNLPRCQGLALCCPMLSNLLLEPARSDGGRCGCSMSSTVVAPGLCLEHSVAGEDSSAYLETTFPAVRAWIMLPPRLAARWIAPRPGQDPPPIL